MLIFKKLTLFLFVWVSTCHTVMAQTSEKNNTYSNSTIDPEIQAYYDIIASKFPESQKLKLLIRQRKQLIPLTTVPSVFNIFRKKENWRITINISNKSIAKFEPILFKNLSDSAKIGVLGHELSHAKDFYFHKSQYILKVFFWHLNPRRIDAFEYNTDKITIYSGVGEYLKVWSKETHTKMDPMAFNRNEKKETERYMRPETIERIMKESLK